MSIYDDLSYTYPREIIIALIITAIVFWLGLRMTRKAERRFQRTRAAAPPLTPPHSGEWRGEPPAEQRSADTDLLAGEWRGEAQSAQTDGEAQSAQPDAGWSGPSPVPADFVAAGHSGAVSTARPPGTESEQ